ncbi:MAG: ATP-binding protein [Candidatus Omnitrophica bacterium]|nr:ATP-binding protein [Candidatus Omnitrophota bacterium]
MIKRTIQEGIEARLFKGKVIIIYGARQVGKTTLIKEIQKKYPDVSIYFNCDEPDIREAFTDVTSTEIKNFIGTKRLVFLDEAQRVENIGLSLKIMADTFPEVQVVATGSSSFELSNKINEPLTGRKYEFHLYPFSINELKEFYSWPEILRILETRILLGMYPEIVQTGQDEVRALLKNITSSYLYKDVFQYQGIKNPDVLEKLLRLLALQVGNEVSYNELAGSLGIDKKTVSSYIRILEKAFVVFRLGPFSRNLRKELTKLRKIYFYDTGIRNTLINNFNNFDLRQDVGALWENFIISERLKFNSNRGRDVNIYFWRTHQQQEIDYIEEKDGRLSGFEFKWKKGPFKAPKLFIDSYPESSVELVTKENFKDFLS